MNEEQENIAFLISRIVIKNRIFNPYLEKSLKLARTANRKDPTFWLARKELDVTKATTTAAITSSAKEQIPIIEGYPSEFPLLVHNGELIVATRVFVAEALASWSFYNRDRERLNQIVDVGLTRFSKLKTKKIKIVQGKLTESSEVLIYFVTHIVLVATMYGELKWTHEKITELLLNWLQMITPHAKDNLEIWIEIILCLQILSFDSVDIKKYNLLELYDPHPVILDPHKAYHTYILWAGLFASLSTNHPLSTIE